MAASSGNGRPAALGYVLPIAASVAAILATLLLSFVQDIRTRLDRIETIGSPATVALKLDVETAQQRLKTIEDAMRALPVTDAQLAATQRAYDLRITRLDDISVKGVEEWSRALQRIATMEAGLTTAEGRLARLRADLNAHTHDDEVGLRDQIKQLQSERDQLRQRLDAR